MLHNPLLRITNLKKHYLLRGGTVKEALKGISLDVHPGEVLGLLGINGAGKTTLSSILATLHPPTAGAVAWNGESFYDHLNQYRQIIGFCPQSPNLNPNLTLQENLMFAGRFYRMDEASIKIKLDRLVQQFDLSTYLHQKADVLSGGYRQRFMIARTLMHDPRLVILDEPTVGLDPHVRHQLWEKIRDLKRDGTAVILTTHYLDEAETLSDRVCILDQGEVKLIGAPEELLTTYQKSRLEEVFLMLLHQEVQGGAGGNGLH